MKNTFFFLFFCFFHSLFGQKEMIFFQNPSLEGKREEHQLPRSWSDCGDRNESSADTQPSFYGCSLKPQSGESYVGMVVRDNGTKESIAQQLHSKLKKGQTYSFTAYLAKSPFYLSKSSIDRSIDVNYNNPCTLVLYLGSGLCHKRQKAFETQLIDHKNWQQYEFTFTPNKDFDYILLEANHKIIFGEKPYCGNILIDNLSAITEK